MSGFNEYIEELFAEFAERHAAGDVPDPGEFARRAGAGEPRLRELIAAYLTETEPVLPSASTAHRLAERFDPGSTAVEELLAEFAERHAAGDVPDPGEFARRAGAGEPRLRELIAAYLTETEPVPPNAAAARELAERFAPSTSAELVEDVGEAFAEVAWLETLKHQLQTWLVATVELRREILDHISADLPALDLRVEATRGKERAPKQHCVFQLDHPAGAQVEVRDDRVLLLTVFGLPTQFVGSRPLIALPRAALADTPQLSWAGRDQGLPDGIALADNDVRERRELKVVLGQLSSEPHGSLDSLLAEIRVIGETSGDRR